MPEIVCYNIRLLVQNMGAQSEIINHKRDQRISVQSELMCHLPPPSLKVFVSPDLPWYDKDVSSPTNTWVYPDIMTMVTLLFQTKQTNLVFDWHGLGLFISIKLQHPTQLWQNSSVVGFDKKMASLTLNSQPSKIYSIWENLLRMF